MMLAAAIEGLYKCFGAAPKPTSMVTCDCCVPEEEAEHLLSTPLRELSGSDLSSYASNVFHTVGGLPDFKYLLPRIFEIWSNPQNGYWPEPEVLIAKLGLAKWDMWSAPEREAVEKFLEAWFAIFLELPGRHVRQSDGHEFYWWDGEDLICGIGLAGIDLTRFLEILLRPVYHEQLAALYFRNFEGASNSVKISNPFWSDKPEKYRQLLEFFEREDVLDAIAAEPKL